MRPFLLLTFRFSNLVSILPLFSLLDSISLMIPPSSLIVIFFRLSPFCQPGYIFILEVSVCAAHPTHNPFVVVFWGANPVLSNRFISQMDDLIHVDEPNYTK